MYRLFGRDVRKSATAGPEGQQLLTGMTVGAQTNTMRSRRDRGEYARENR